MANIMFSGLKLLEKEDLAIIHETSNLRVAAHKGAKTI